MYLKTIGKSKVLAATMSDTEPEDDSENEDDGILNAFTTIVNPTKGIVEEVDKEEDLMESKFEKMDEQYDIHTTYAKLYKILENHKKLYRLATKKLSDVELEREAVSTKFDCERPRLRPDFMMLGQTHVNGWSRIIASQNGGSTSYIFPFRLRVLQWSCHLFNYLNK